MQARALKPSEQMRQQQVSATTQMRNKNVSQVMDTRPTQIAQRRLQETSNSSVRALQLKTVQAKMTAQRQEKEGLLQGKFEAVQRVEEEEPLQAKFEPVQRVEEEEPL
ncbi:hypothetical protein [Solimicrobium silvestre]|uniref:Uncharacterized protein n=1 Tax=Solimicrobium silvestre TaxID=2099400 RepID=A0A2S9H0D0_9BURK|nr:hypothetical protein [Solimicrobium silvestre]PRC93439.1 hypothetical protein S2091_1826 [Solimicrobium silvestre]